MTLIRIELPPRSACLRIVWRALAAPAALPPPST